MKKEKTLVPSLRFKEFRNDWEIQRIGEFITDRKIIAKSNEPLYSLTIEHGVVPKSKRYERSHLVKGKEDAYKLMMPNDFAFNPMNLRFGALAKYKGNENIAVSKYYDIFYGIGGCDPDYFEFYMTSHNMIQFYNKMSTGTLEEKKRVHYLDFINFKKLFPTLTEQQKIASFLSAVDEKIQQLTKKKVLLEQYKKGVMQQLFSGQLRFKDDNGNVYPDWEEKIFSDLYSFHSTNSLSRDKLNYDAGLVYNIHYGDIHTKFSTAFKLNEAYIPFINDDVDLSKIKDDSYCKSGDLVMADASEDYADIGKTIELIDLKDEKVLAGLHTFLARPITSKTTIGFFSVLLKSWSMRKQIMVTAQGTKVLSLSTTRVGKLKLKLPVIEEQQKIASYLSNIDTKIESVKNQITQTQTFKKGLLQQMFV